MLSQAENEKLTDATVSKVFVFCLIRARRATEDREYSYCLRGRIDGKKDAIVANATTPAVASAFQLEDVAAKGI